MSVDAVNDSVVEEIDDDFENESLNYYDDDDHGARSINAASRFRDDPFSGKCRLNTIAEESQVRSDPEVFDSTTQRSPGSTKGDFKGFHDSFGAHGGPIANNSDDFKAFGLAAIDREEESFFRGHNLQIHGNKDHYEKENSWEPSPYRVSSEENQKSNPFHEPDGTPKARRSLEPRLPRSRLIRSIAMEESEQKSLGISTIPDTKQTAAGSTMEGATQLPSKIIGPPQTPPKRSLVDITSSEFNATMKFATSTPVAPHIPRLDPNVSAIPMMASTSIVLPSMKSSGRYAQNLAQRQNDHVSPAMNRDVSLSNRTMGEESLSTSKVAHILQNQGNAQDLIAVFESINARKLDKNASKRNFLPKPTSNLGTSIKPRQSATDATATFKDFVPQKPRQHEQPSNNSVFHCTKQKSADSGFPDVSSTRKTSSDFSHARSSTSTASDIRSQADSSRPSTAMSSVTTTSSSHLWPVKFSSKRLIFGYIEPKLSTVMSLDITNQSEDVARIECTLRKENAYYEIMGATYISLQPGEKHRVEIRFCPVSSGRFNNVLFVQHLKQRYTIVLRGHGGVSKVNLCPSPDIQSFRGLHTMIVSSTANAVLFSLQNVGPRPAFCKILLYAGSKPVVAKRISPYRLFILRKLESKEVRIEFDRDQWTHLMAETTRETLNSSSASVGSQMSSRESSRFKIRIFWGEEVQLQRLQYLAKHSTAKNYSVVNGIDFSERCMEMDKSWMPPEDFAVAIDDYNVFSSCVRVTDIDVTCNAMNKRFMEENDVTVVPDDTICESHGSRSRKEITVIRDVDETLR